MMQTRKKLLRNRQNSQLCWFTFLPTLVFCNRKLGILCIKVNPHDEYISEISSCLTGWHWAIAPDGTGGGRCRTPL